MCRKCLPGAISVREHGGTGDPGGVFNRDIVIRLGKTCYLCGTAHAEHADHVVPKSRGGSDHWWNVGAACSGCNLSKGDAVIQLTPEQRTRLQAQHQMIEEIDGRLTDAVWWQLVEVEIDDYLYEHPEDLEDLESVEEDVRSWFEGIAVPETVAREVVAYLIATAAAGGPASPRQSPRSSAWSSSAAISIDATALFTQILDELDRGTSQ